ncbi:unnamed protein product [Adineta steineri]|uniref:Uncharacterized protein n=1 Tax=Adineta steineri TaxID=433720 RepID=A0A818H5E1_9BILA|nr:unnamed protein product [Adineta steineri]CAF3502126.1 unnamed protein product [Adineta steineri]
MCKPQNKSQRPLHVGQQQHITTAQAVNVLIQNPTEISENDQQWLIQVLTNLGNAPPPTTTITTETP